jgi:hypothetical protein
MRLGTAQSKAYTSSSAGVDNAFGPQTNQILVVATSACHIAIGDGAQTATTSGAFIPANWPFIFTVTPGQRIAAIRAGTGGLVTATDGTLYVTELG